MLPKIKQRPTSSLTELGPVPWRHLTALFADLIQLDRQRPPSTTRAQRFSAATRRAREYARVQRFPNGTLGHRALGLLGTWMPDHMLKCSRKLNFGKSKHWVLCDCGRTPAPACQRQRLALSASTRHPEMRRRCQSVSSRSKLTLGSVTG